MSSWAASAEIRILHLRHELKRLGEHHDGSGRLRDAKKTLDDAEQRLKSWSYLRGVIQGTGPEEVWGRIHEAEEIMLDFEDDDLELHERAKDLIRAEFPRRLSTWERDYASASNKNESARYMIRRAHDAASAKWTSQRNHQRGILLGAVGLIVMALLAIILQALSPDPFLPPPPGTNLSPTVTLTLVMVFGALGGILSGLIALYLGSTKLDNTRWLDVKPTLMLAKAATGVWFAVIGAAAVGTKTIVGEYTSTAALLLLAVIFGYSQQAVTTFLDQRAAALTEPVAS